MADEVRKLSERTANATQEIASMIEKIQSDTGEAIKSINAGNQEVQNGKELTERAGAMMMQIVNSSMKVVDEINQVATAGEEQAATAEQIGKSVEMINNVSVESVQGIEQIAHATGDLSKLSNDLQILISNFKINNHQNPTSNYGNNMIHNKNNYAIEA